MLFVIANPPLQSVTEIPAILRFLCFLLIIDPMEAEISPNETRKQEGGVDAANREDTQAPTMVLAYKRYASFIMNREETAHADEGKKCIRLCFVAMCRF